MKQGEISGKAQVSRKARKGAKNAKKTLGDFFASFFSLRALRETRV